MKERAHFVIHGRVQGVCFRAFACDQAARLGLTGWVRNLRSGAVEIVAEGERPALDEFLDWCRRGPPDAIVREVATEYPPATGEFREFGITYGA